MLNQILDKIINKRHLSAIEAEQVMNDLMEGVYSESQVAALLVALRSKGETVEEVSSFAKIMREKALRIHPKCETLVDTCGTGGDHSGSFNISTTVAFVVSGAGVHVAKHGNRSASSKCGSADVLEALGVKIDMYPESVAQAIEEIGIGFLFAPQFHNSMKHVVPARKAIGVRTVFNILGPLTNPAGAKNQVIGVFDPEITEFMAEILKELGARHAMVVHGDGLDEITITGPSKISELKDGRVNTYFFEPQTYGVSLGALEGLKGGDAEQNAKIMHGILHGDRGPKRDIVIVNAAAALIVAGKAQNFEEGIQMAKESIDSGAAMKKLTLLKGFNN